MNIVFIHNTAIHYRLPLFELLENNTKHAIKFWIYHEKNRPVKKYRYFSYKTIIKYKFSFSILRALCTKKNIDLIILAGSYAYELPLIYLIIRLRRISYIYWTETWNWGEKNLKNRFFTGIETPIARNAKAVLYAGSKTKEYMKSIGIASNRLYSAPNSSLPIKKQSSESNKKNNSPIIITQIARYLPRKGIDIFIKSAQFLPKNKFELHIGGSGDVKYMESCKKLARTLGVAIIFHDDVDPKQAAQLLKSADIVVYPSIVKDGMGEPWGLLLNEAVHLGKPIVSTTAVAAAFDLIDQEKNGIIINEVTPKNIAQAIIAASKLEKNTILSTSKKKDLEYSFENMTNGFIKAINSIL